MPPSHVPPSQPAPQKGAAKSRGKRYELSSRAQSVLTWILEDIIEKTLEDARRLAEATGKTRVDLLEIEQALRRLCERYHARFSQEHAAKARGRKPDNNKGGRKRKDPSKRR